MHELTQLLCQMISIPSLSREELQLAEYVKKYLSDFCDTVEIDSMNNVIAVMKGKRSGPTILFNSHLDHVPPGDLADPYKPVICNANIFHESGTAICGRAACDNKGAGAAMMYAAKNLASDRNFAGTLILLFVAREEEGQAPGTSFALKNLDHHIDLAILGEATDLDVYLGHRGKVEFFLDTYGKSAHASNPSNGVNAIELMSDFIQSFNNLTLPFHEILGECTSAITYISCPDPGKSAMVPEKASLRFDRRFIPSETPEKVYEQVDNVLRTLSSRNANFKYKLDINYVMPSFYTDQGHPMVRTLDNVIKSTIGKTPKTGAWLFGGDGAYMVRDFNITTIGFGPASEKYAHTSEDHVLEEDLISASLVYENFIRMQSEGK